MDVMMNQYICNCLVGYDIGKSKMVCRQFNASIKDMGSQFSIGYWLMVVRKRTKAFLF